MNHNDYCKYSNTKWFENNPIYKNVVGVPRMGAPMTAPGLWPSPPQCKEVGCTGSHDGPRSQASCWEPLFRYRPMTGCVAGYRMERGLRCDCWSAITSFPRDAWWRAVSWACLGRMGPGQDASMHTVRCACLKRSLSTGAYRGQQRREVTSQRASGRRCN